MTNEKQTVTESKLLYEVKEAIRDCFVGHTEEKEGYILLTLTNGQVFSISVKEEK